MNDLTPFSSRSGGGGPRNLSEWALQPGETEGERLERYCSAMNARDPYKRLWFVNDDGKKKFVDCRDRLPNEWGGARRQ